MNHRKRSGRMIAKTKNQVRRVDDSTYVVLSQTMPDTKYTLARTAGGWDCSCPDTTPYCKHAHAVEWRLGAEGAGGPRPDDTPDRRAGGTHRIRPLSGEVSEYGTARMRCGTLGTGGCAPVRTTCTPYLSANIFRPSSSTPAPAASWNGQTRRYAGSATRRT